MEKICIRQRKRTITNAANMDQTNAGASDRLRQDVATFPHGPGANVQECNRNAWSTSPGRTKRPDVHAVGIAEKLAKCGSIPSKALLGVQ